MDLHDISIKGRSPQQVASDSTLTWAKRERLLRLAFRQLPESDQALRRYAVWCARRALGRAAYPAPESIKACDLASLFAKRMATAKEMSLAGDAALKVARELVGPTDEITAGAAHAAAWAADPVAERAAEEAADEDAKGDPAEREAQVFYLKIILESAPG